MRKSILTGIALLPLLLSCSHAAQITAVDPPGSGNWVFSSEDSGASSYLGVDIADVTSERLSALKLKEEKGVEVTMVDQDAPAGKAGLKEHDVILSMNGAPVESAAQLRRMIHETPAGRLVTLGLSRDGQPMTIKLQLADRHKEFSFVAPKAKDFHIEIPEIHMPDMDMPAMAMVMATTSMRSGLTVENITPQLGEFFGAKNGNGILVRSVEKGSRAEKAGFRAGDVIVKVNDQSIHDTNDFAHAVRSRTGDSVSVGVIRDKKEQNLNLTLPERKDSGELLDDEGAEDDSIEAESVVDLGELKQEIAKLRPEMEVAAKYARESAEEVRKSVCKAQKQVREDSRKQRQEFQKEQEQLKKEIRRMSQQLRRNWLDL